ncbi:putative membrane protein [Arboricoccus pini]|uniref:Putative membrane protein n=1 Tax=Arboricoccus pini TaxID=1963835 RepID=A0A212QMP9_9PROT|nr:DUF350 domain-containing protein [Arboricoccus pini]SNB60673.1 putative membrane protein [Arboricoccus pini]
MHIAQSLAGLPAFIAYYIVGCVLLGLYGLVYTRLTPYDEMALIRANNVAAAIAFAGSILGFIIPLAAAFVNSVGLFDAVVWGLVALIVQVGAYRLARLLIPGLCERIPEGEMAPAIYLAVVSLTGGMLQSACMSY